MQRIKKPRISESKARESLSTLSLLRPLRNQNATNAASQLQMVVSIAHRVQGTHLWPAPSTFRKISKSAGLAVNSRETVPR